MTDNTDHSGLGRNISVLVVEDEFLIAMDLQMILELNGYDVIGPVASIAAALNLLEGEQPDVAVLDVNLRGQPVVPVAERLQRMRVPFVLASAYSSFDFEGHEVLEGAENVRKPISKRHLLEALGRAVGPA